MAVFVIALIAFTNAFYLIGRNQLSYTQEGEEAPSYSSLIGAAHHVYTSSLGEFDTEAYFDNDMSPVLALLFICLSFFMCIHLLNMLIAIMGESFSQNSKVAQAEIKISQLAFVVDNWWINPIDEKEKIVYLVAAFSIQDDDDEEEVQKQLERDKKIDALTKMVGDLLNDVRNVKHQVADVQSLKKDMEHYFHKEELHQTE